MYKFFSLRNALTSPQAWNTLAVGAALLIASPALAETAAVAAKAPTTAPASTAQTPASTKADGGETPTADPAPAEPTAAQRDEARLAFEAGSKAFAAQQFDVALASFKQAYEIIPSPHAEYWIALSMDKADPETKDPKALAAAYETFLTNPGAGHVGAEQVTSAKSRLDELRKGLPATVTIVSNPAGASVTVNGQAKEGVTPLTMELPAGTYQVGLTLAGYDSAKVEVKAEGGIALEQQITLGQTVVAPVAAAAVVHTASEPEPQTKSMVPAIVTLALGGAGLVSGTVFGIMALNSKAKFNDDPTVEHADAAERNALIADMSFGIALTLGLTGIVLLTSDDPAPTSAKKQHGTKTEFAWAPYASPFGGGAAARVKF